MKSGFFDKLIERLDKLDSESLHTHFLRLAQERGLLETVFQSIQEGIIVVDPDGKLAYANAAAEKFMGFSLETVRGRPVSGYLRDIDWDRVLHLDAGEWSRLISHEIEVTYPEHRFLSFYIVPLPGETENESGVLMMLRDVTRERRTEADFVESERLNAVKLLAAGVAHEIGNPLNSLNIHLQLLDREINKLPGDRIEDIREVLDVARNEVSRLDIIITQFLRAIRPSQPKLTQSRVENLLKETLTLLKQEIQDRKIEVEIDNPERIPTIRVDQGQIKQAFFNLISNAFQAMPDGGSLRIVIREKNEFLAVSFRDTGIGIKKEDMGRIFEPYHTTKKDGSGLGLMIVQRIIQDHGGQIEVVSKSDAGTNLTIYLPLAERRLRLLKARGDRPETTGN